jgi:cytochrome P450
MAAVLSAADFYTADYARHPERYWRQLREDHPCFHDTVADLYVLSRYEDVAVVFADHQTYSAATYEGRTGAVLGPTLISRDDHGHVVRRSIVAPDLVGKRLQHYRTLIEDAANALIDQFAGQRQVELIRQYTSRLPVDVIAAILGMVGDGQKFREWVTTMIMGLAPERHTEGRQAHAEFCAHIGPALQGVEDPARTDFIAKIARASVDGEQLDHDEIVAFCGLLFIAGGETTDKAMSSMWWNLLHHPDQYAEVLADPTLWDAAFSETMRHSAPVISEDRFTTADVEWHGVAIPAGAMVRVSIGAAHNDETVFTDPESFDLHRSDLHLAKELRYGGSTDDERHGHLGFGLGKHFCIGYELARLESVLGSQLLVERCGVPALDPAGADAALTIGRSMRAVSPDVALLFPGASR